MTSGGRRNPVLERTDVRQSAAPRLSGPVVTAPIQIGNELRGSSCCPRRRPAASCVKSAACCRCPGPSCSSPPPSPPSSSSLLRPGAGSRRSKMRLNGLEAGDLTSRAPDGGSDEIARVSRAFNRMADDLASRDEALRTSDRLRRQMLADVSHELKTPLTAMRGYVETLRMPEVALDEDRRARYLETIESETLRLDRIVKDLLALARYENNVVPHRDARLRHRAGLPPRHPPARARDAEAGCHCRP